jgi:hypothetical protein
MDPLSTEAETAPSMRNGMGVAHVLCAHIEQCVDRTVNPLAAATNIRECDDDFARSPSW